MPRVVVAPDKFKGSLGAAAVAGHLAAGVRAGCPDAEIVMIPVADGGDGTVDAAVAAGFRRETVRVTGPTGMPVEASWARRGGDAVVELASASGLALVPQGLPAPLTATSRGTGEVVRSALDAGCTRIVVGIGGSASTDGGAGLLGALGARFTDRHGGSVADGGAPLAEVKVLDLDGLDPRLREVELVVACDVDNPLSGPRGAAAVYGPQKGASAAEVKLLDAALVHWADLVADATGRDLRDAPGAGAAGGVGFALIGALGATSRRGADIVFELTGLRDAVAGADLVVTGEGSIDEQTLHGKAPAAVAEAARAAGVPVVGVAGRCLIDRATWESAGFATVLTTTDEAGSVEASIAAPGPALERIGERIGERLGRRLGMGPSGATAELRDRSPEAATRHTVGLEGTTKESAAWLSTP
ncbi:glycerate kinase [Monashia sp. NPDC004114]